MGAIVGIRGETALTSVRHDSQTRISGSSAGRPVAQHLQQQQNARQTLSKKLITFSEKEGQVQAVARFSRSKLVAEADVADCEWIKNSCVARHTDFR